MSLILFFVCLVIILLGNSYRITKANKKVAEMESRGEFLDKNYDFFRETWHDVEYNWQHDRSMFPKEYWTYFCKNPDAEEAYVVGLVGTKEMKAGYKPVLCSLDYDKNTFDPFSSFEQYKDKIENFNKTGKFIW